MARPLKTTTQILATAASTVSLSGPRFKSRGPFKCVVGADGQNKRGIHKALLSTVSRGFAYDARGVSTCRARNTIALEPPADVFIPLHPLTKNTRTRMYSMQEGCKLDRLIGEVCKWVIAPDLRIPLPVFYDKAQRDHVIGLKFGMRNRSPSNEKLARKLRALCDRLTPEAENIVRFLHAHMYTFVGTQVPVCRDRIGTTVDLVVRNRDGHAVVIELKNGCTDSWTHNKTMAQPYTSKLFTTHREHLLQTMIEDRLYRHTFPYEKVAQPLLLRADKVGLHIYHVPAWMRSGEEELARRMGC